MAKIMVIDDEEPQRTFLRERLEHLGHEVQCLASADEGLKLLLAKHKFDLVLSDVHMSGIRGTELVKLSRNNGLDVPIILITNYAPTPIKEEVEKYNALVVSKLGGGNNELWRELEPKVEETLKAGPEGEVRAHLRRAFDAAFKLRQRDLVAYLEEMLHGALILWALRQTPSGNQNDAERILGVRLEELREMSDATPQERHYRFVMRALILIHKHPDWTNAKYADYLDCGVSTLFSDPIIGPAMRTKKASGRKPRTGFRDAGGNVDAPDE